MSDDQPEPPKPPTIHLGMMSAGDKGPGSYIGGAFKLRGDLDQDLRSAALDFMKAADRCLNGNKEEAGVELLTVPGAVCAALACELLLKFVLLRETGQNPRGHQLEILFGKCSEGFRLVMDQRLPGISELFVRNSTQFVDGRYHFERPQFSFRQAELLLAAKLLTECVAERFPERSD
jgi:HEPN domain-containing protein